MPNDSIQFCHQLPELAEIPQILGSVPQGWPTWGTSCKLVGGGEDTCISDQPATDQRFPQPLSQLQQFARMVHKIQENLLLTFTVGFFVCLAAMQGPWSRILVPQPGIEPPRACSEHPNHWSTREVPTVVYGQEERSGKPGGRDPQAEEGAEPPRPLQAGLPPWPLVCSPTCESPIT